LDATQTPGHYKTLWTGANNSGDLVKAGVYFCQLQAEDHTRTLKMVYMK